MLLVLRAEAELVNVVNDFAQVVAALNLVLNFAEDFANLVFDGVRPGGALLEAVEVGKELGVDEVAEGGVMIQFAILARGGRPRSPAVGLVEDMGVFLPVEGGLGGFVLLEAVEVFQEQEPGGLLGVVQLGGAAGLLAEDVVNVAEGLFKHRGEAKSDKLCFLRARLY